ncbi:hypothetical protein J5277_09640 [Rhizobium sp. 16-449-1b]|uniref:hypothetical protein n=1 Tax=Rhizobium sp. 16-449-1b TaxID=2819989 RepID=UPI001AD99849|nr:hypothetical protein [Rhizobium sp. 16-449-1b]MBO9194367.1 hypothetical protein [Rhizobium sp. 16-449-1b]
MPPVFTTITGTPLDYVPIDATVTKKSRLQEPTSFRAPTLKRASIAALVAAVAVGVVVFAPVIALAAVAIGIVCGAVHLSGKAADRLNDYDRG